MATPIPSRVPGKSRSRIVESRSMVKAEEEEPVLSATQGNISFDDGSDEVAWDLTDDGRPKTRRVNPQRLAIRLGPDLVAEMEALIIPGAKMPTFTIRKDFQERYSVDRRHIYDYFHSRGLRVAKEDKHTNLIRGRAMKAQALALAQSQASAKATCAVKKRESPDADSPPRRPFRIDRRRKPYKRSSKAEISTDLPKEPAIYLKRSQSPDTLGSPPIFSPDISSDLGPSTATSSTDTEWETTCPQFTIPLDSPDPVAEEIVTFSDFLSLSDDVVFGYPESPPLLEASMSDIGGDLHLDLCEDTLVSTDDQPPLTQTERKDLYELISNSIPYVHEMSVSSEASHSYMHSKGYLCYDYSVLANRVTLPQGYTAAWAADASWEYPLSVEGPDIRSWLADDPNAYVPPVDGPVHAHIRQRTLNAPLDPAAASGLLVCNSSGHDGGFHRRQPSGTVTSYVEKSAQEEKASKGAVENSPPKEKCNGKDLPLSTPTRPRNLSARGVL